LNNIYVVKWTLDGKSRMVSTDDWVPGSGSSPSFAKPVGNGNFWLPILEK